MGQRNDAFLIRVLELEPVLRAFLRRYAARPEDQEDLLQDTYLRLLRLSAREQTALRSIKAYALTVARNLALDWLRNRQVVPMIPIEDLSELNVLEDTGYLEATLAAQQELEHIERAVAALPARCREVFTLRKLSGLSQKEIATRLSISENTVEQHLVKALRRIRTAVAPFVSREATRPPRGQSASVTRLDAQRNKGRVDE